MKSYVLSAIYATCFLTIVVAPAVAANDQDQNKWLTTQFMSNMALAVMLGLAIYIQVKILRNMVRLRLANELIIRSSPAFMPLYGVQDQLDANVNSMAMVAVEGETDRGSTHRTVSTAVSQESAASGKTSDAGLTGAPKENHICIIQVPGDKALFEPPGLETPIPIPEATNVTTLPDSNPEGSGSATKDLKHLYYREFPEEDDDEVAAAYFAHLATVQGN